MEEETVSVPKKEYDRAFYKGFPKHSVICVAESILKYLKSGSWIIRSEWYISDYHDSDCFGRPVEFQASLDYLVEEGDLVEITLTNPDGRIDDSPNKDRGNKFYLLRENWGPLVSA